MHVVFSCVCDDRPPFPAQTRRLVATLISLAGVPPSDIVIHLVGQPDPSLIDFLDACKVMVRRVALVSAASRTLNKLVQFETSELQQADVAILCDCDLAFAGDVRALASPDFIRGRQVSQPRPPLDVWRQILRESALKSGKMVKCTTTDDLTPLQNLNGGLLMIPRPIFHELGQSWPRWSAWIEERKSLLQRWLYHIDQVSFALACIENKFPIELIPPAYNYPVRPDGAAGRLLGGVPPLVLHYHHAVDDQGRIVPQGHPAVDAVIDRVNTATATFARSHPAMAR